MVNEDYPGIVERVKAVLMDYAALLVVMIVVTLIFSLFEEVPENLRMLTSLFIFILYEPLCLSAFGATIGHMNVGIRVKREKDQSKNISFPMAFVRFVFKTTLGWLSLLTVSGNPKRKAIHDFIAGSVVVFEPKE
jgi:uncharacterized RDD family membrane protein YckC